MVRGVKLLVLLLWEGKHFFLYLLSYHLRIVARFNFEGAVVRPEIHGIGDAGNASLIDLKAVSRIPSTRMTTSYQFRCLRPSN